MMPPPPVAPLLALLAACVPVPSDPSATPPPSAPAPADLAVLGVNGRLVTDDGAYWIPLDAAERVVPLGTPTREAFALVNTGGSPLAVEAMWLTPLGDTVAGELELLAPTRASEVPLDAGGAQLAPGERLDFDVAVRPRASGVRRARLTARWADGPDLRVELRARADGALRLHDPGWPTWPEPSWSVAGPAADGLRVDASALHHGSLYLAALASDAPDLLVARVAPEGQRLWVTAVTAMTSRDESGAARLPSTARGVCVGGAGVGVVGDDASAASWAPDTLAVTWLGRDGALAWSRAWSSGDAVHGGACVAGEDHVWVVGVTSPGTCHDPGGCVAAPDTGGRAGLAVLVAAFGDDGEPLGTWTLSPGGGEPLTVAAAIAGRGDGLILGGRWGDGGYVARLEDGALDVWHALNGPVEALAPLDAPGRVAVASRLDDGLELAAIDADGLVVWRRIVRDVTPAPAAWDGGVALASGPGTLSAVVGGSPGVAVLELESRTGSPRGAAQLVLPGAPRVAAASADGAGLRFAVAGVGLLGGDEAWYQAAPPEGVDGPPQVLTLAGTIAPHGSGLWRDTSASVQAWDASADAVVRPLDALGDAPADLVVTGLPRPGSG